MSSPAQTRRNSTIKASREVAETELLPSSVIEFGREISGDLAAAEQREWLVTNGIGGFASGTVAGSLTRRYHGLLLAALKPPVGRTLLVTKLDEFVECDGRNYPLATNRWRGGLIDPAGYAQIERFRLEGTTPVWTFVCADARVEKRIWMQRGENTTYSQYRYLRGSAPIRLTLRVLVNYRDFHAITHGGDWEMQISRVERGLRVLAYEGATAFYLLSATATTEPAHVWYRNFDLAAERYRGLEDSEDHLHAGTFEITLLPGEEMTIVASTEAAPNLDGSAAYETRLSHERSLLKRWLKANPNLAEAAPDWVRQLVLAADQFIVRRQLQQAPEALSVIAGYHWFGDWGRDTMIALPGLTLVTGRTELARKILLTFACFVHHGMLPNILPAAGETPEYNTVDATLWYFEAVRQYYEASRDQDLLRQLFPVLTDIVDWHVRGTQYNIHVDPDDGLLYAGESGVQLTWMDAKVGDWVVTPRIGKPVEVNALWLNALVTIAGFARALDKPADYYEKMAAAARSSFRRFWNESAGCCFDVIDGPEGSDASLRPNQILAVSLPESPLTSEQRRAVVDVCARQLLTSHGLRSLAPDDPHYRGHYGGPSHERDAVYHQGTVWAWLLGPFVEAHWRVHRNSPDAASFLEPMAHHLLVHGLGSVSEIFDGDAPFTPRGCIAQAWSVAEVLRGWTAITRR